MDRLVRDLLDVVRLEAGHLSIDPARCSSEAVLREALETQRVLAEAAAVELRLEVEGQLADLWADRERLLQVFENLIGNALRFTAAGGAISVGARPRERDVLFWVRDTGAGIGAEELAHLFDRLWQSRRSRRHGAGLGLAIARGLVEAHGGRIWVESVVGVGTTFFSVPIASQAHDERPRRSPQPHA